MLNLETMEIHKNEEPRLVKLIILKGVRSENNMQGFLSTPLPPQSAAEKNEIPNMSNKPTATYVNSRACTKNKNTELDQYSQDCTNLVLENLFENSKKQQK